MVLSAIPSRYFRLILPLGLISAFPTPTHAASKPVVVTVGTFVNQIYGVDLKNNSFNVDFYIWCRWNDDSLHPLDSLQLVNGRINSKSAVTVKRVGDLNVASARIAATITKFWNMERFPLDRHELTIELEDGIADSNSLIYQPDRAFIGAAEDVRVPGWTISRTAPSVTTHRYKVRIQPDSTSPEEQSTQALFSRYVYSTFIERPGYGRFVKLFLGLFVSVLVAYLAFFVRPKDLSPRVGLGTGAIFAVAANSFSINSMLPETGEITMADRLILGALTCVASSIVGTIWSAQLSYRGRDDASLRFDRACARILPVAYISLIGYCVLA